MTSVTETPPLPQPPGPAQSSSPALAAILALPAWKLLQIGAVLLATLIAGGLVSGVIEERERRHMQVLEEFQRSWGPAQTVGAPLLVVPYDAPAGTLGQSPQRRYLKIAPAKLKAVTRLEPERRRRGLFEATVYQARAGLEGAFALPSEAKAAEMTGGARPLWVEAFVVLPTSGLTGLSPEDRMVWGGTPLAWQNCREAVPAAEDCQGGAALAVRLTEPVTPGAEAAFAATLTLRGTGSYRLRFQARDMESTVSAPWPTPSFTGTALPAASNVTKEGFEATWRSAEYALPQHWTAPLAVEAEPQNASGAGVDLIEATPGYRMVHRASKYDILFVALAFTTYFLFELLTGVRIHAVQYGLLGLSLTLFGLLLVSFSEPLGYAAAYALSAGMVLAQATLFTAAVTRRARTALLFGLLLGGLFGFLYVLLSLETYALLVGTLALFAALSLLMAVTQRVAGRAAP
ncbi:MAG TPA: cell envelope integrity protein CreD [Azospirillaceae bacterium]|nr:cell envelope integrity protein CreD [Azospirillaceae bacterium]